MHLIALLILTLFYFLIGSSQQSSTIKDSQTLDPLHFVLLNKGESIKIPLDGYFPFSNKYSIYEPQSSQSIKSILDIEFHLDKIQNETSQPMVGKLNEKDIDLSKYKILDIKTIYNQPNKIFLLQQNIIMMYSYRQKSQQKFFLDDQAEQIFKFRSGNDSLKDPFPRITIFNISADLNITGIKNFNLSCVETEALPFDSGYKLIVLCRMTSNGVGQSRNYIVTLNMDRDDRGFITNLRYNSSNFIQNNKLKVKPCNEQAESEDGIEQFPQNDRSRCRNGLWDWNMRKQSQDKQMLITENGKMQPTDIKLDDQFLDQWNGQNCQEYHLKYFDSLVIEQKQYFQTVIAFCNGTSDFSSIKQLYEIGYYQQSVIIRIISNPLQMNITTCLINSKFVTEYQNGFVSIKSEFSFQYTLRIYKYSHRVNAFGKYETECAQYNPVNLFNYSFITSRNQSGVQTIYVIYSDKIMIFESYSPNYQTLNINPQKLTLKSYAISNQILSLHFQDPSSYSLVIKAYNIKAMYPHLVDKVEYNVKKTTGVYLFSVMNYLEKGNYFFIYEREKNILNLTYYTGQYVNITIKDPAKAVGLQKLSLINSSQITTLNDLPSNASILPIYLKIRAFCDTSIETVEIPQIKLNSKLFNIDLVKAVIGPLGRFYKMTNPFSSLQFVNSFHQIDITDILNRFKGKKLMTFSIDDFLNLPILTFYFQDFLFLKCGLEFDFYLMRPMITRCFEVVDSQTIGKKPEQIIIYEQQKFIQHQGHQIQFCRIQSTRDTKCVQGDFQEAQIKKIKLIKYYEIEEGLQFISVFIIFEHKFKQKDYIAKCNATVKEDIQVLVNVEIGEKEIEYLKYMTIRTIQYDEEYSNFLLVYMMDYFNPVNLDRDYCSEDCINNLTQSKNCPQSCKLKQTYFHIVQIYAKPQLKSNQSSHFVGHLIQQFTSTQLENVFIIDNKILMLSIQPQGSIIEEYIIKDFKCIISRTYPLYDHTITKNGSHSINSGFLFVQVQELEQQVSKYLVYNPCQDTTNIITHSFEKINDEKVMFIQKLAPSENVMAIHGNKLITLSLPNMVIKLNQGKKTLNANRNHHSAAIINSGDSQFRPSNQLINEKQHFHSSLIQEADNLYLSDSVNVSFIDNNDILRILSFQYSYDISDSKIDYDHHLPTVIPFDSLSDYYELEIDPTQITGPVSQYDIKYLSTVTEDIHSDKVKDICHFLQFNSSDIFTKTKCIKYFNSKQDGIMQDFLTYEAGLFEDFTIIVTDRKILCIENMKIQNSTLKNKTKDCNIFQQDSRIFIVCTQNNSTTMSLLEMQQKCQFNLVVLQKPDFLKYNIFKMMYSRGQAIFQVPIRSQTNKIYYVTRFYIQNKTFDENSMLLKHGSQEQFITFDFTTDDTFMFLLQNGLGIFNLTKRNETTKKLTPDVWVTGDELMEKFNLDEDLAYVNCLELNYDKKEIILEIGTILHSFQLHISYQVTNESISIKEMNVRYQYKNPWSCYNTLLSKSRYYQNMTIKMCSFMPQEHYIFSNFIPISENKHNSYIIFYQKNFKQNQSYPFRMDIIYTNIYSNDNFQIPIQKANLFIGSLFNLLCQYDLRDSYKFNFTINPKIQDFINDNQNDVVLQKKCHFYLNLSNQNYQKLYNITIKLNFQNKNYEYWTDWKHWIQRVFILLIMVNYIRLEYNKRAERIRLNTIRIKRSRSNSFDQQFDLQVRFHSKKAL